MSLTSLQVCLDMDSTDQHRHQWLQATVHEDALMDSSSSPSGGADMLGSSHILMSERRLRPPQDQALKCPRCESTHTKFCYYNNYSLSQPRYFCKTCRRYWTKGGTLRNIPVGGGYRKNRKASSSNKKVSSNEPLPVSSINNQNPNPNIMMMMSSLPNPVDLQLSFPFSQLHNMMITSGNIGGGDYRESMLYNKSIVPMHESSSAIDLRGMDHKQQVVEAVAIDNTSKSNNYGGYFSAHCVGGGGYDMQNLCYADHDDLRLSSYIDSNNTNYNNSANEDQLAEYSGLHAQHHNNIHMQREVKPNPKMLALDWQQEAACPDDANGTSKQESFGGYDRPAGSWWGSAGNSYHHQLHPSATTNNTSLH